MHWSGPRPPVAQKSRRRKPEKTVFFGQNGRFSQGPPLLRVSKSTVMGNEKSYLAARTPKGKVPTRFSGTYPGLGINPGEKTRKNEKSRLIVPPPLVDFCRICVAACAGRAAPPVILTFDPRKLSLLDLDQSLPCSSVQTITTFSLTGGRFGRFGLKMALCGSLPLSAPQVINELIS